MASQDNKIKMLLQKALKSEKDRFSEALVQEFKSTFPGDFVMAFSRVYDQLLMSGEDARDDPTSPANIRAEVISVVSSRVKEAVSRLSYEGGSIHLQGLSPMDLGFLGAGTETIDKSYRNPPKNLLFAFYIIGMISDVVFISKETYKKLGRGDKPLGRFGEGFLMDGTAYKKLFNKRARSKTPLPPYEEVVHPFSGKGPINFFGILRNHIDLNKYINNALKKISGG